MTLSSMITGSAAGSTPRTPAAANEKVKDTIVKPTDAPPVPFQAGSALGQAAAQTVIAALRGARLPSGEKEEKTKRTYRGGSGGGPGGGSAATYVDKAGNRKTGVTAAADPYWDAMRDYYLQAYQSQVDANNARADAAAAQARAEAESAREALNAGYRGTNRQLYRDYMERQRVLPQQLAAQGYSGGLTESARIRLGNSYGESLAENERARLAEDARIGAALARQEYESRAAADAANRQALQTRYGNLAELRTRQYQQQRADALSRAQVLAAAGDYSGYRALGYTPEEIEYLSGMWRAENPDLAEYQRSTASPVRRLSAPEDSSAYSVARYIRQTQGLDRAIEYVAEELAAGHLFSDEAESIRKLLRQGG